MRLQHGRFAPGRDDGGVGGLPGGDVAGELGDQLREGPRVAVGKAEAAGAGADAFGESADGGGDDRAAEHPGLRHDQPEDLRPRRGNDNPVDLFHARGEFPPAIGAAVEDPDRALAEARDPGPQSGDRGPMFRRREMFVGAVDGEFQAAGGKAPLARQQRQRLERDVQTLVVAELAEEAEPVEPGAAPAPVKTGRRMLLAIGDDDAFLECQAPVEIKLGEEFGGKDEMVAVFQHGAQPPRALGEEGRRVAADAGRAGVRLGAAAEFAPGAS